MRPEEGDTCIRIVLPLDVLVAKPLGDWTPCPEAGAVERELNLCQFVLPDRAEEAPGLVTTMPRLGED